MAHKLRSWLAFLLVLMFTGHFSVARGAGGPLPAVAASNSARAASSGNPGKVDANWDRDLFAIFREGPEPGKSVVAGVTPEAKKIVPLAPKKPVVPRELKLQGIVYSDPEHAAALVDGKVVRLGELVDGWRVHRITRHGLLLADPSGGREYELLASSARPLVRSCAVVTPNPE